LLFSLSKLFFTKWNSNPFSITWIIGKKKKTI
jgi:hypothetical protein